MTDKEKNGQNESETPSRRSVESLLTAERKTRLRSFLMYNKLPAFRSLKLLEIATMHRSFANEHQTGLQNERLEFLGDSVISLVVASALYHDFPTMDEGEMSRRKSVIVSRSTLGRRAYEIGLTEIVLLGTSEENNGGRYRDTLIGSALEAVVGAIYLEKGLNVVQRFIIDSIYRPSLPEVDMSEYTDYKSRLQELVQRIYHTIPQYTVIGEHGPEHLKEFEVAVNVMGERIGRGRGNRKRSGENSAAKDAFDKFTKLFAASVQPEAAPQCECDEVTLLKKKAPKKV